MIDHLDAGLGFAVGAGSLFAAEKPKELVNYLLRRRGMLTSNVGEAYGFLRSRPELELPDLELIFAPAPFYDEALIPPEGHGIIIGPILVAPESRGEIRLRSADPHAKPVIEPRYLSDPGGVDRAAMMEGLRICARLAEAPALKRPARSDRATAGLHRAQRGHPRAGPGHLRAHAVSPARHLPDGQRRGRVWWIRGCGSAESRVCGWPTPR